MKFFRKIALVGLACLSIGALSVFAVGCGEEPHVHNYFRVVENRHANCQEGGYTVMGCDCGETIVQNETPPTDHDYMLEYTQPPTASEGGFTEYRCKMCGDSYIGNQTAPLGITVYFDAFNGAGFSQNVGVGEKLTKPNDPVRAGYEFNYWGDGYGNEWNFEEGTAYEGLSLRAYYTAIEYDIVYNLNGGVEEQNPLSYTAEYEFTLNTPTKRGYEFLGWTGTDLDEPTMQVKIKDNYGDREYVANWRARTYTITFNTLGNGEVEPKQVEFDGVYGTLPTLQKDHYTFNGWYTSSAGGVKVEETTTIDFTANKILYARLTPISYNITYTLDGGYASGNPKNYDVEDSYTLVNPTKYGYDFMGWTGTDLTEPSFEVVINHVGGDREYTANWQAKTINLTFNSNGGTVVSGKSVVYGSPYGDLPTTQRPHYQFLGWYKENSSSEIDKDTIVYLTQDTVLYAKWQSIVEFKLNEDGESYTATGLNVEVSNLTIPDTFESKPVTEIASYAFYEESCLESVVIGNNVSKIGISSFRNCDNLTSVVLGDAVKTVENEAFFYSPITNLTLNENLEEIKTYAFSDCNIFELNLPTSLITIGTNAFADNREILSITLPQALESIGQFAFDDCVKLVEVKNNSNLTLELGSSENGCVAENALKVLSSNQTENNFIEQDGFVFYNYNDTYYLMRDKGQFTQLVLPNDVAGSDYNVYKYAFFGNKKITSLQINEGAKIIGERAFGYCSNLAYVSMKESVIEIGINAFDSTAITEFTLGVNVATFGDYALLYCDKLEKIVLNDLITEIPLGAFHSCSELKEITIGKKVVKINDNAFYKCEKLEKVIFNGTVEEWASINFRTYQNNPLYYAGRLYIDGKDVEEVEFNTITYINHAAFYNLTTLRSVKMVSVQEIGNYAFMYCGALEVVDFGNKVSKINSYAFVYCTSLSSVEMGDSLTSIDKTAFQLCTSLESVNVSDSNTVYTSVCGILYIKNKTQAWIVPLAVKGDVVLPDELKYIDRAMFSDCNKITSIVMGNNITSLPDNAFDSCTALTEITLSSALTSIDYSFRNCPLLKTIRFNNTVAKWNEIKQYTRLVDMIEGCTVYCTDGQVVI